jgi:hypothetical protein
MAKFTFCTLADNGVQVMLNLDVVKYVEPTQQGSIVRFVGDQQQLVVKETPNIVITEPQHRR